MGLTYTLCYCAGRKCKARLGETKEEMFDSVHWGEISENTSRYLSEDVCVPYANERVAVPEVLLLGLEAFVTNVAEARRCENSDASKATQVVGKVWASINELGALAARFAADSTGSVDVLTERELQFAGDEPDPFLPVARLLAEATRRSVHEVLESRRAGDATYIFHHVSLVFDTVQEMHRLAAESLMHLSTERLLQADHPHYRLLETRWEEAGI